jgi:hypothetical protein
LDIEAQKNRGTHKEETKITVPKNANQLHRRRK